MSIDVQDLHEFHGWDPFILSNYLEDKGWKKVDCFNDYKYAWISHSLNKSIIAKIEFVDEDALGNEMVIDVWSFEGVYSDKWGEQI